VVIREWALITFTILAQMSVGAFLVLGVVHSLARSRKGLEEADRLSERSLLAIGGTLVLGMGASLLHLGSPLNAYLAIGNLGTSWLSREITFGVGFAGLGALFALMQWRKVGSFGARQVVALLAALVGLALVYSMSQVYMLPAQPAWNSLATPVSFFATTVLLGSLAMGSAFVLNYWYVRGKDPSCAGSQCELLRDALKWIAVVSLLMLGVEFVVLPIYVASLAMGPAAALGSVGMLVGQYGALFGARLALVFLGAGVFGVFLYQSTQRPDKEGMMGALTYGAFGLVLVSEVLGRFLFYATHLRIGI
jgi:anaerobic dimethyl sulfoxide reductase subunit C (anchor subunit)